MVAFSLALFCLHVSTLPLCCILCYHPLVLCTMLLWRFCEFHTIVPHRFLLAYIHFTTERNRALIPACCGWLSSVWCLYLSQTFTAWWQTVLFQQLVGCPCSREDLYDLLFLFPLQFIVLYWFLNIHQNVGAWLHALDLHQFHDLSFIKVKGVWSEIVNADDVVKVSEYLMMMTFYGIPLFRVYFSAGLWMQQLDFTFV